jgi:lipoprotein-releasing system ATP-binding protein
MILEAKDIHKSYDTVEVLKGIDLVVDQGEIVSIVGSSGAGKSTLLHIIGTLDRPDSGSITINGINPFTLNDKSLSRFRNQHIGFIFQFHHLLPEFTATENVFIPLLLNGVSKTDATRRAEELLALLGLSARRHHKPSELSGGEQQRVAVARALANSPSIVLADEPSGNLDSQNARELHQLFFQLRQQFNQTFVIVTHNEELANMADRKLTMKDGRFISSR